MLQLPASRSINCILNLKPWFPSKRTLLTTRVSLQAHRKLAETHLVRVQTHMEEAQPSEIAQGGYIHLPDRTKMKRHYMKKLGGFFRRFVRLAVD